MPIAPNAHWSNLKLWGTAPPPRQYDRMSPVDKITGQSTGFENLELAIDIVLNSPDLAALCKTLVTHLKLHGVFEGAHVLLNTNQQLNYDSGFGLPLPTSHEQLAIQAITSKQIEFLPQTANTSALTAIPFIHNDFVEAVGILIMHKGATSTYINTDVEPALKKLTGFYLATTTGLDH